MAGRDPFAAVREAMASAAATYEPRNARDVEGMHAGFSGLVEDFGSMLTGMGQKTIEGFPINSAPAEMLQGFGAGISGIKEHADAAHSGFRTSHGRDLARIDGETGRVNEEKWDVTANQD